MASLYPERESEVRGRFERIRFTLGFVVDSGRFVMPRWMRVVTLPNVAMADRFATPRTAAAS